MAKTLIPIFGDQLTLGLSSLATNDPDSSIVLMMEVHAEAMTVPHHRKKLIFLFSAMRHFAQRLKENGWTVDYVPLTEPENTGDFTSEVQRALNRHTFDKICLCEPSEYRVLDMVESWEEEFDCPVSILVDDRFICRKSEFADWAEGRKQLRMEYFYREIRRKTDLLMDGDKPEGGKWNYDKENRKPAKPDLFMPKLIRFEPDSLSKEVIDLVAAEFETRLGEIGGFDFGVTREDALKALSDFLGKALPCFGDYQDAMLVDEPFLYHSLLSLYLNVGLLDPLEICEKVEEAYRAGDVPLNSAEGYIRQIIGWREYVRGIYWLKMPAYLEKNALDAKRDLPDFYWTGNTDMMCLSQSIGQTLEHAYAHHIQRLMITGNFALLIGVDPQQIHEWYLAVYVDAFEWVELPNTLGMSQFGDGGLLGSKPYASSGSYIDKMSNYCGSCRYDVKERVGENACPFNSLYWHFINRNKDALKDNHRMRMIYSSWDKMDGETRKALLKQADKVLDDLKLTSSSYF